LFQFRDRAFAMLISFSVSNFRSFYEEATLNMLASSTLSDPPEHHVPIGDSGQHVLRRQDAVAMAGAAILA